MSILEVKNLCKTYEYDTQKFKFHKKVSFKVDQEEFFALFGLSSSGKSTLLRCLNESTSHSGGSIKLNPEPLEATSKKRTLSPQKDSGLVDCRMNFTYELTSLDRESLVMSRVLLLEEKTVDSQVSSTMGKKDESKKILSNELQTMVRETSAINKSRSKLRSLYITIK